MVGVAGQLGAERALGAAVALTERVQGVEVGEELGEPVAEPVAVESAQEVGIGEPAEHLPPKDSRCWGRQNGSPLAMLTVRSSPPHGYTSPKMCWWNRCRCGRS